MRRHTVMIVALLVILAMGVLAVYQQRKPAPPAGPRTFVVAPDGSDSNPGTIDRPFGTLAHALQRLRRGDTLLVRGGVYREQLRDLDTRSGVAGAPIRVLAWEGERPVLQGLLWLRRPNYWTIDGLNVTWDPANRDAGEHMVRFIGGHDWVYANAEVWGARSYAAILVTGGARDWSLRRLYVHDTQPSNEVNQDHLIYVSDARRGTIEGCLLVNSPNGRGVKLGRPEPGERRPSAVTVRYNTIIGNASGNVSLSYDAHDNLIERNILVGSGTFANIDTFQLDDDTDNAARDNIGWAGAALLDPGAPLVDEGGNRRLDPLLDDNYRPTNPALLDPSGAPAYGHLALPSATP